MALNQKQYRPMTFRAWYELATPNTWGASVIPVLLGAVLAYSLRASFSWLYFFLLLIAAVSMHCAVNAFNHGFDFLKGTDCLDNCLDPTDAPVVYHRLDPRKVILLGCFYLLLALLVSAYIIWQTGPVILVIGVVGALVAFFYPAGPLPITHTPFGEFFAGFTMGGLITLAVYYAMTLDLSFWLFWYASPVIIAIGMVLLLNNVCDIEKDIEAQRRTLPILIGRPAATALLRGGYVLSLLLIAIIGCLNFLSGMWLYILLLLIAFPKLRALFTMEFTAENRIAGMRAVLPLTPILGLHYVLIILLSTII